MTMNRATGHSDQTDQDSIERSYAVNEIIPAFPDLSFPDLSFPDLSFPDRAGDITTGDDRRRPGRAEFVSAELVELLRLRPAADVFLVDDTEEPNAMRTAKGIGVAALLGVACWTGIIGLIVVLIR